MPDSNASSLLSAAPWIAWRTFRGNESTRCVISDEASHTYTELDGAAAEVWEYLARGTRPAAVALALEGAELTASDVEEFQAELTDLGLLSNPNHAKVATADPAPTPVPLEDSENVALETEFMQWAIANGFLWSCHWEITYRCNESCVHCYNPGAAHLEGEKADRTRDELSTEEAKLTLDRLAELGLFRLTISGGEAFLRQDLLEIVGHARGLGISVDLYTNGLRLTEDQLDRLARLWPRSVSVSIYSDEPAQHDAITRVPGSYDRSVDCLKRLNARGIKTAMKAVAFKSTAGRHEGLKTLAGDLGAALEIEGSLIHGQDGSAAPTWLGITDPAHLIELAMTPNSPLYVGSADNDYGRRQKDFDATVCGAGVSFLHLDPEGNILPCASLPLEYGNVRDIDIRDLWRENRRRQSGSSREQNQGSSLSELEGQALMEAWSSVRLRDYYECGTHERCSWCQKCPGKAMLDHGDPLAPSTTDCRTASARMWAARLLEQGVSPTRLQALRGVYDTDGSMKEDRSTRAELSSHATRSLLPVLASAGGSCGSCGSAQFCSGEQPSSVDSALGLDAKGVTEATSAALKSFEILAKEHLLGFVQEGY
jgi:MoaA/NifB/PqqE/SkfB family radical SAM enzyme